MNAAQSSVKVAQNTKNMADSKLHMREHLQEFLDHYQSLSSLAGTEESTCPYSLAENDLLNAEYEALKKQGTELSVKAELTKTVGALEANRKKNRYKDIIPFDNCRVTLKPQPGVPCSDYINANFVKGIHGTPAYIAAQAPLPRTVDDFWRMIWEHGVKVVIMACNEVEAGKPKCERYWPTEQDTAVTFGSIKIILKGEELMHEGHCIIRRLQAQCNGSQFRTVLQYHYTTWPDHGIPAFTTPILDMLAHARRYQPSDNPCLVVHCSAGCGRTGTILAIDYVWNLLKEGRTDININILEILSEMRTQRPSLVQTRDQYEVVYLCVIELFKKQVQMLDNHLYQNISPDQSQSYDLMTLSEDITHQTDDKNHYEDCATVDKSADAPLLLDLKGTNAASLQTSTHSIPRYRNNYENAFILQDQTVIQKQKLDHLKEMFTAPSASMEAGDPQTAKDSLRKWNTIGRYTDLKLQLSATDSRLKSGFPFINRKSPESDATTLKRQDVTVKPILPPKAETSSDKSPNALVSSPKGKTCMAVTNAGNEDQLHITSVQNVEIVWGHDTKQISREPRELVSPCLLDPVPLERREPLERTEPFECRERVQNSPAGHTHSSPPLKYKPVDPSKNKDISPYAVADCFIEDQDDTTDKDSAKSPTYAYASIDYGSKASTLDVRYQSAYAYADSKAVGKWSLQKLARGYEDYLTPTGDENEVEYSLANEMDPPPPAIPRKTQNAYVLEDGDSQHMQQQTVSSQPENIVRKFSDFVEKIMPKRREAANGNSQRGSTASQIPLKNSSRILPQGEIMYCGHNISFPNRVPHPAGEKGIPLAFKRSANRH